MMKRIILMLCTLMLIVQPINLSAEETQPNLDLKGKSVILVEQDTGEILYENNSNQSLPPAFNFRALRQILIRYSVPAKETRPSITHAKQKVD